MIQVRTSLPAPAHTDLAFMTPASFRSIAPTPLTNVNQAQQRCD